MESLLLQLLLGAQSETSLGIQALSLSPSSSGFSCGKMTELVIIKISGYRKENSLLLHAWLLCIPNMAWEGKGQDILKNDNTCAVS